MERESLSPASGWRYWSQIRRSPADGQTRQDGTRKLAMLSLEPANNQQRTGRAELQEDVRHRPEHAWRGQRIPRQAGRVRACPGPRSDHGQPRPAAGSTGCVAKSLAVTTIFDQVEASKSKVNENSLCLPSRAIPICMRRCSRTPMRPLPSSWNPSWRSTAITRSTDSQQQGRWRFTFQSRKPPPRASDDSSCHLFSVCPGTSLRACNHPNQPRHGGDKLRWDTHPDCRGVGDHA
jgi:hypothetical protein